MPSLKLLKLLNCYFELARNKLSYIAKLLKNNSTISERERAITIQQFNNSSLGFTLIEILVALTIITLLSSAGFISINNALDRGRDTRRKEDLATIKQAAHLYFEENGRYPPDPATNTNTAFTSDTGDNWIPDLTPTYIKQLPKDPKQQAGLNKFLAIGGPKDAYAQSAQLTVTTFCQNDIVWFSLSWQSSGTGFGPGSRVYNIYENGAGIWSTSATSYQKSSGASSISEGSFRFQIYEQFLSSWSSWWNSSTWSNEAFALETNCVTEKPPPCPPLASAPQPPAGSQTIRFAAPSFGDLKRSGASYPPEGQTTIGDAGDFIPMRTFNGATYFLRVSMVGWDTGSLPDNATIHSAILQISPSGTRNDDKRNLTAEWYNNGWPIDTSDWTATAGTSAFTCIPVADLTDTKELPLTDPAANINKGGVTALRLHISGGKPKGFNHVILSSPILIVNYTVPQEPTPTPAPGPCSADPTPGPNNTFNLTICKDFSGYVDVDLSVINPNPRCQDVGSLEAGVHGSWPDPKAGWPTRAYLRFPLAQLPQNAIITQAQLRTKVESVTASANLDFAAYGGGFSNPLLDSCLTRANLSRSGGTYATGFVGAWEAGVVKTIQLPGAGTQIQNGKQGGANAYSLAINEDGMTVAPGFPGVFVRFTATGADMPQLLITYTTPTPSPSLTPSPSPSPVPSPSPLPGGGTCTEKQNVYCYIVTPDHLIFILWAKLENANDPEISSKPQAACTAAPPDDNYNYCLGPD